MTDYIHVSDGGEVSFIPGELNVPREKVDETSEYIVTCDEETASWIGNDADSMRLLVRCRDCKHFTPEGTHNFENGKTNTDCCKYIRGFLLQITPDGFCAWAERKEVTE